MTLVGTPRLIFLDEPTTGLDPRSRRTMWRSIRELVAGGVTIFLTTQYLDEADQLADRIAVLDHGRIVAEGSSRRAQTPHPGRSRPAPVRRPGGVEVGCPACSTRHRATRRTSPCRCPATAAVASLRRLLGRLETPAIEVEAALHPHPRPRRRVLRRHRPPQPRSPRPVSGEGSDPAMSALAYTLHRFGDDAAPQPAAAAALPVDDAAAGRYADRVSAAVRLRLRRPARRRVRRRTRRWARRPWRLPRLCDAGHPADDRGRRRAGHRDQRGDGHDRRASSTGSARWPSPAPRCSPAT